jgi:hypothetical protein
MKKDGIIERGTINMADFEYIGTQKYNGKSLFDCYNCVRCGTTISNMQYDKDLYLDFSVDKFKEHLCKNHLDNLVMENEGNENVDV